MRSLTMDSGFMGLFISCKVWKSLMTEGISAWNSYPTRGSTAGFPKVSSISEEHGENDSLEVSSPASSVFLSKEKSICQLI